MGSIDEARQWLAEAGIPLSAQTIQSMTYEFARRVRAAQKATSVPLGQEAMGRRVVVSVDGGRIRVQERTRGRKTKNGRTGYHGEWREPKLLMIYIIDPTGHQDHSWCAVIDGVLTPRRDGGDAIFALLKHYLQQLKINAAIMIVFLADGAPWIWRRVQELRELFLLREDQVLEVIDFYHAVQHLGEVAQAIDVLCRGRRSRAIRAELEYFHKNASRMRYRFLRRQRLPSGSGAIESAVRRVVNLRLKGPGIFWYEENANAMLLLRSYYKSGHVQQLMALALAPPRKRAA
jgi:hypothetical protein